LKKEKTKKKYSFEVKVWLYPGGTAAWHFVTVPKKESADIAKRFKDFSRGWGSLPVEVAIGQTTWNTSIFPDRKMGTYLLPLKKEIRKKEDLQIDNKVKVTITILP
jgi:hypothetical protein